MKLTLLSEAASAKKQEFLARKFQVDPSIVQQASDTDPTKKGKYVEWIISRIKSGDIDLTKDASQISSALKDFEAISNKKLARQQYNLKDINQYNLDDVVNISRTYRGEAGPKPESVSDSGLPGVRKFYDDGVIAILEVTDPDSAVDLAGGTKWCTSNRSQASSHLEDGPLYVIYKNGKKLAQTDGNELKDLHDEDMFDLDLARLLNKAGIDAIEIWHGIVLQLAEGRELDLEPHIVKDPSKATYYAIRILKDRWPEAEPIIMKDPDSAQRYAKDVIQGRWPEAEPYIMKDPRAAAYYAAHVIEGRWPEAEPYIKEDPVFAAYYAANVLKGRWPELEPAIMKDPSAMLFYAENVIEGRWPEAEEAVVKNYVGDPHNLLRYAANVIKGRWPELEPIIMKYHPKASPQYAYNYAKDVLKQRWPEAEPMIMKNPWSAYFYAKGVLEERWPEAEPYIKEDERAWENYYRDFKMGRRSRLKESLDRILGL
jgi:hypothetical protein